MDSAPAYRPPVPLFLPALTAALALMVLFVFGVREQQQLAGGSVERIVGQREQIAQIVAVALQDLAVVAIDQVSKKPGTGL